MNNTSRVCYLKNLQNGKKIELKHEDILTVGRSIETEVQDKFVSKKQVECCADLENSRVKVNVIGKAVSGINGFALKKHCTYIMKHADIIEVRIGGDKFEIIFDPKPEINVGEPNHKKIKKDFPIFNSVNSTKSAENDNKKVLDGQVSTMWEEIDNKSLLIYTPKGCQARDKIAAFDLDGTIIKTKSGARFPKDKDDWTFYLDNIPNQLKKLFFEDNFKIVFLTNQAGLGIDAHKIRGFKSKIENIIKVLDLPIQTFIATGKNKYRKPIPGMWDLLVELKNDSVTVDTNSSFYVGDAAGREKNWAPKRNKDFSCCDRIFALNIGLQFYTPEEFFLSAPPAPFKIPEFDPRKLCDATYPDISYDKLNVILMVGGPGSGKSIFCRRKLIPHGYVHVSRDKLGSWQKCVKSMEENLNKNRNVVIDNTNVDADTRKRFIDVAKKLNADVRCFVMNVSLQHMKHNNKFRELTDKSHAIVSDIIILSYNKNYQEPDESEGYTQILKIPFIPKFDDLEQEKLYKMFLVD